MAPSLPHSTSKNQIIAVTLEAWNRILSTTIGGVLSVTEVGLPQQTVGILLQRLIAYQLAQRYPGIWRGEQTAADKDLVHIPDSGYSIEVKSSTHKNQIFGNRSYGQVPETNKKSKDGYYLAVNCDPLKEGSDSAQIHRIRFGWLDHSDWRSQAASSGQQASLTLEANSYKLLQIYPLE